MRNTCKIVLIALFVSLCSCKTVRNPERTLQRIAAQYPALLTKEIVIDSVPVKISLPAEKFKIKLTDKDTVIQRNRYTFDVSVRNDSIEVKASVKDTIIFQKEKLKIIEVEKKKENHITGIIAFIAFVFLIFILKK